MRRLATIAFASLSILVIVSCTAATTSVPTEVSQTTAPTPVHTAIPTEAPTPTQSPTATPTRRPTRFPASTLAAVIVASQATPLPVISIPTPPPVRSTIVIRVPTRSIALPTPIVLPTPAVAPVISITIIAPPTEVPGPFYSLEPNPTPVLLPTLSVQWFDPVEVREYAKACGDLRQSPQETVDEFFQWVSDAQALTPPSVLQELHDAWVGQFAGQIVDGELVGPNEETQEAYWQEVHLVTSMSPVVRQVLVDEWCLLETEVSLYIRIVAAQKRLAVPGSEVAFTLEQYANRCADMQRTAPLMGSLDMFFGHIVNNWETLVPPSGLEGYHQAVLELYLEWQTVEDFDLVSLDTMLAVREQAAVAALKHPDFLEVMIRAGCTTG